MRASERIGGRTLNTAAIRNATNQAVSQDIPRAPSYQESNGNTFPWMPVILAGIFAYFLNRK